MIKENHLALTEIIFRDSYPDVHRWMDELIVPNKFGFRNWVHRHHLEAIAKRFGEGTTEYMVAYLHILTDWVSHTGRVEVPKDRDEVIRKFRELKLVKGI